MQLLQFAAGKILTTIFDVNHSSTSDEVDAANTTSIFCVLAVISYFNPDSVSMYYVVMLDLSVGSRKLKRDSIEIKHISPYSLKSLKIWYS